jgi:hypothetical protein
MKTRPTVLAALLLAGVDGAAAAEPPVAVDAEFLEFLGSLDTEDEEWREYLAERPVPPEAGKTAGTPAAAKKDPVPPDAKSGQQDKVKQP